MTQHHTRVRRGPAVLRADPPRPIVRHMSPRVSLFVLTVTALVAFAGNSILNRAALVGTEITPAAFTAIRLGSGAVMLAALLVLRPGASGQLQQGSWLGAAALAGYAIAFSFAYVTLDAGIGALALFGGVQVTMFAGVLRHGGRPPLRRWLGAGLGLAGLTVLLLPGASAPDPFGLVLMLAAAVSWGVYSLLGQGVSDPLAVTAGNFLRTLPLALILAVLSLRSAVPLDGAMLAVVSGAVTSALGYAVWYAALRHLDQSLAAVLQLTVPLIALGGGMLFLGEAATWTFAISALLVAAGVIVALPRGVPKG